MFGVFACGWFSSNFLAARFLLMISVDVLTVNCNFFVFLGVSDGFMKLTL